MRVTNGMLIDTMLWNLSRSQARLDRLQDQMSSGQRIRRPSDDPAGVAVVLRLDSTAVQTAQYRENIDDARAWLDATDRALNSVSTSIQRATELGLEAANGTLTPENREAIAAELRALLEHVATTGNSSISGQYIFSGQKTRTAAFDTSTIPPTFQGDTGAIVRAIDDNVTVAINVTGDVAIQPALDALYQAYSAVSANDPAAIRSALDTLDAAHTAVLTSLAEVGARANRLDAQSERLADLQLSVAKHRSDVQDVDLAQAVSEYALQETVYRAALASGARAIQPSLIDYLG